MQHTWIRCIVDTLLSVPKALGISVWAYRAFSFKAVLDAATRRTGLTDLNCNEKEIILKYDFTINEGFLKSKLKLSPFGYFALHESL